MNNIMLVKEKIKSINELTEKINIMEVCGTHTTAISKFGFRDVLSHNINLISGPGCPVCVTSDVYIDYIYELSLNRDIIITTYGDMIRVPGSSPHITLENAKALGADVRMVYSSMDALKIAANNTNKKVVFIGIGFETTTPYSAVAVRESEKLKLNNFFLLSLHKKVEPVMRTLLEDKTINIDGFLCPGHVAAVIGQKGFEFLQEYNCAGAVAGFEADEIIDGIESIINDIHNKDYTIKNKYERVVRKDGNILAASLIDEFFDTRNDIWRGMGEVKLSGFKLKEAFRAHDIEYIYPIKNYSEEKKSACQCGEVLKGKIKPFECKLFEKVCNPDNPVGPCMVSGEGSCAAYYRYR